jgi:hypothetical protein
MGWLKRLYSKAQEPILNWAIENPVIFRRFSYILNLLLLLIFILWILQMKIPGYINLDAEAAFAGISSLAALLNQFNRKLFEKVEYSPAEVLALGYVNNFLFPAIMQLKQSEANPVIYIYKPNKIKELDEDGIENMKGDLLNKYHSLDKVVLDIKKARYRDILIIKKDATTKKYLDFPSTLVALLDYIDYKVVSKANTSTEEVKAELGRKLIDEFYIKLEKLLEDKLIKKNVKFCDFKFKLF